MADTANTDLERLRQLRDAYLKARRSVERINRAQVTLRELHIKAAAAHGSAKDAYERARDQFCEAAILSLTPRRNHRLPGDDQ